MQLCGICDSNEKDCFPSGWKILSVRESGDMKLKTIIIVACCTMLLGITPVTALDLSIIAGMGGGLWTGPWSDQAEAWLEDFSLVPASSILPVGYIGVGFDDLVVFPPLVFSIEVGLGSWGGLIEGKTGDEVVQSMAITGIALEAWPSFELTLPTVRGEAIAEFRIGAAILASKLWTVDAWPGMRTVAAWKVPVLERPFIIAGLGAGYRFGLGRGLVTALVRIDAGFGLLDPSNDDGTVFLGRATLLTRYDFPDRKNP